VAAELARRMLVAEPERFADAGGAAGLASKLKLKEVALQASRAPCRAMPRYAALCRAMPHPTVLCRAGACVQRAEWREVTGAAGGRAQALAHYRQVMAIQRNMYVDAKVGLSPAPAPARVQHYMSLLDAAMGNWVAWAAGGPAATVAPVSAVPPPAAQAAAGGGAGKGAGKGIGKKGTKPFKKAKAGGFGK